MIVQVRHRCTLWEFMNKKIIFQFGFKSEANIYDLQWSPLDVPHKTGTMEPPDTKNWSELQMWFRISGPSLNENYYFHYFRGAIKFNFSASPAIANCSKSKRIWQISGWSFRIVSWQLPVPSIWVCEMEFDDNSEMFFGRDENEQFQTKFIARELNLRVWRLGWILDCKTKTKGWVLNWLRFLNCYHFSEIENWFTNEEVVWHSW